jgi:uncharacterized protein YbjQ (UPF0145 family)
MFGKKKDITQPVPVYTVQTVPQAYELIQLVSATSISELGKAGAEYGADAVIGLVVTLTGSATLGSHMGNKAFFGTAIRYVK